MADFFNFQSHIQQLENEGLVTRTFRRLDPTRQQAVINAILEEKPYPVKAALFVLTNPMVSYPNSKKTREALIKLDFIVVHELFMTATQPRGSASRVRSKKVGTTSFSRRS